jgi:6-phosphofructokinase 2
LTLNPALDLSTSTATIVPSEKLRCATPRYDPGGGGINVARAVHALGGRAVAVFPAGGPTGHFLADLLRDEGVSTCQVPIVGTTRESVTVDERETGRQFRFVMPGPSLSMTDLAACEAELRRLEPRPEYIVASGSLPPGLAADSYGEIAKLAGSLQAKIILDTSGAALQVIRDYPVFLVKPNRRELEALVGEALPGQRDVERAAARIIEQEFAEIVVVSLGADGAVCATKDGLERYPSIDVDVQSSVGAGDSMIAGIVLSLSRGRSLRESVRYGIAAGTAALLRPGTELCRLEDVEGVLARMPD